MAIITSTRLAANIQRDGRFAVQELHVADGGESQERTYLAESNSDLDALLAEGGRLFLEQLTNK